MNKTISTFLKYLKYFGIFAGSGFVITFGVLMVHFYMSRGFKEESMGDRVKEAFAKTVYIMVGFVGLAIVGILQKLGITHYGRGNRGT